MDTSMAVVGGVMSDRLLDDVLLGRRTRPLVSLMAHHLWYVWGMFTGDKSEWNEWYSNSPSVKMVGWGLLLV